MSSSYVLAVCALVLLTSLLGGIIATAILSYEKPGAPRELKDKMSFKLWIVLQVMFVATIGLYHTKGGHPPTQIDWVYWVLTFILSPLVAKLGSGLSGIAYNQKLKERSEAYEKWLDENMTDDERIEREIEEQTKITDDKDHDDFAFVKNYDKEDLK